MHASHRIINLLHEDLDYGSTKVGSLLVWQDTIGA